MGLPVHQILSALEDQMMGGEEEAEDEVAVEDEVEGEPYAADVVAQVVEVAGDVDSVVVVGAVVGVGVDDAARQFRPAWGGVMDWGLS